jgi:hypothetical protein
MSGGALSGVAYPVVVRQIGSKSDPLSEITLGKIKIVPSLSGNTIVDVTDCALHDVAATAAFNTQDG